MLNEEFLTKWEQQSLKVKRAEDLIQRLTMPLYEMLGQLAENDPSLEQLRELQRLSPPGMMAFRIALYIDRMKQEKE